MPTVPTNDNAPANGDGNGPRPSSEQMIMAAATMYRQGRLTQDQQPTQATDTEQASQQLHDPTGQSFTGAGIAPGTPEAKEALQAYHDIGETGQRFTPEGKRRSEKVEDYRESSSLAPLATAEYWRGKITKITQGQNPTFPWQQPGSTLAKQAGIGDIERASTQASLSKEEWTQQTQALSKYIDVMERSDKSVKLDPELRKHVDEAKDQLEYLKKRRYL